MESENLRVHSTAKALWIGSKVNVGDKERLASVIAGAGLAIAGLSRIRGKGALLLTVGGYMIYRGLSGHCHLFGSLDVNTADERPEGILVDKSIEIAMPPEDLFRFWRDFENLPRFMGHLEAVRMIGDHRYHWIAKAPAGMTVEWDAEVVMERSPDLIVWRSMPGADIPNEGSVRFTEGPLGLSTVVHVSLRYYPPAGKIGAWVASLFGEDPSTQIEEDLRHFKDLMEE